jgi:hypothetical protein
MAMVDQDGRLFGRINLIDAAIALAAILAIPVGFAAYRIFSAAPAEIGRLEPSVLAVDGDHRLRLDGRNFRPYMKAFFSLSGAPFSLLDPGSPDSGKNQAKVRVATTMQAELTLPAIAPGTYDLYLYDQGREVARRMSAFTVTERGVEAADVPYVEVVTPIDVTVRFEIETASVALVKAGDTSFVPGQTGTPAARTPVLMSVRKLDPDPDVSLQLPGAGTLNVAASTRRTRLEGVVRVGARRARGFWQSAGPQPLRIGEPFMFESPTYTMRGVITHVAWPPVQRSQRQPGVRVSAP